MGECRSCVKVARNGETVLTFNTWHREQGPVDAMSVEDYELRQEKALGGDKPDPTVMFSDPDIAKQFSKEELDAYGAYLAAGRFTTGLLVEGAPVTAYSDMRDL
jgi:hypothetical protein